MDIFIFIIWRSSIILYKINYSGEIYFILVMNSLRKYLTQYLVQCNKLELAAQHIRQTIAENPYFQPISAFERFDKFKKGYLEPADFSEFMLENQIYPSQGELYLIFRDFDRYRKGIVTIQDFEIELLPRQNRKLRKTVQQRHPYPVELKLEIDLQFLLGKYFQHKINSINTLNDLRDRMKILKPDAFGQAFHYIDTRNYGYITKTSQIDSFLRNNSKALNNQELQRIYRVLNFDLNTEISLAIFVDHLDPFVLGTYPGYRQKLIEKQSLSKSFLIKQYEVQQLRASNIAQNAQLHYEIEALRDSNRRLRNIMDQQDLMNYYERKRWNEYY